MGRPGTVLQRFRQVTGSYRLAPREIGNRARQQGLADSWQADHQHVVDDRQLQLA